MKTILSLDGGGMRGFPAAWIISYLEERAGKPSYELFDRIAGTSIGGIMATILAHGGTGQQILGFFTKSAPAIFKKGCIVNRSGLFHARYDGIALEDALITALHCDKLKTVKTNLIVPTFDLNSGAPVVFTSRDKRFDNIELWKIARGSSAAQSYFPPMKLNDWMLWDGGNTSLNNPAMEAWVESNSQWPREELLILSLGCGQTPIGFNAKHADSWGLIKVGITTLTVNMETGSEIVDNQCSRLLGKNYVRINPTISNVALDDASPAALARLKAAGIQALTQNKITLDRLADLLKSK